MEILDLIRMAHEIDRHLANISTAVTDGDLKKDLITFHARWRDLGHRVTAELCGVASSPNAVIRKRRGRPRKLDATEVNADTNERIQGPGS